MGQTQWGRSNGGGTQQSLVIAGTVTITQYAVASGGQVHSSLHIPKRRPLRSVTSCLSTASIAQVEAVFKEL
jgi:hypothetical protein